MPIYAKSSGADRELVPAGSYLSCIIGIYDIGTQSGGKYAPHRKCILQFELHNRHGVIRNGAGKPMVMSKFYGLSFSARSQLRKDCEKLKGRKFHVDEAKRGFDITELLETPCRVDIVN